MTTCAKGFVCSTAARIISVNRAGERLTGYSQKELISTDIVDLFTGESQDKIKQLFSDKLTQLPAGSIEVCGICYPVLKIGKGDGIKRKSRRIEAMGSRWALIR